jgi:hypothetical protein
MLGMSGEGSSRGELGQGVEENVVVAGESHLSYARGRGFIGLPDGVGEEKRLSILVSTGA